MVLELERIWKEVGVAYPGIRMEGLNKTTQKFSEDSRCPGRDPNREPTDYKSGALRLCQHARCFHFHPMT
jgi:hypothetical protein